MKKMILLVAFLTLVAFISGALAQPKPAEKQSSPVKPRLEKFSGSIEKVDEVAKILEIKQKIKKEEKTLTFTIDDKTKIDRGKETLTFSSLKKGMHVSVEYKKDGDRNVAMAIKLSATMAQPKKAEEKKPSEPEKK